MWLKSSARSDTEEALVLNDNRAVITVQCNLNRETIVLTETWTVVSGKVDVMSYATDHGRLTTDRSKIHVVDNELVI